MYFILFEKNFQRSIHLHYLRFYITHDLFRIKQYNFLARNFSHIILKFRFHHLLNDKFKSIHKSPFLYTYSKPTQPTIIKFSQGVYGIARAFNFNG